MYKSVRKVYVIEFWPSNFLQVIYWTQKIAISGYSETQLIRSTKGRKILAVLTGLQY